jgi:hypothetical protein
MNHGDASTVLGYVCNGGLITTRRPVGRMSVEGRAMPSALVAGRVEERGPL